MHLSYRVVSILLIMILVSCTSPSPLPTQQPISSSPTSLPLKTSIPTSTPQLPTQISLPRATFEPTQTAIVTKTLAPTQTPIPTMNPFAITSENVSALVQVDSIQRDGYFVSIIAFSPDGELLATGSPEDWDKQNDIFIWNLETSNEYARLSGHKGTISSLAFNPNGEQLASGGFDGTVRLWNLTSGKSITLLGGYPTEENSSFIHGVLRINSLTYSPDGGMLAVSGGDVWGGPNWLELYDITTGKQISMLQPPGCDFPCVKGNQYYYRDISFSPDGKTLLVKGDDGIGLWDVDSRLRRQLIPAELYSLDISPDGKITAGITISNGLKFYDLETGAMLDMINLVDNHVHSVAFSPVGNLLAVSHEQSTEMWDLTTQQILRIFSHSPVFGFSPDGSLLAIGDIYGAIHLFGVSR